MSGVSGLEQRPSSYSFRTCRWLKVVCLVVAVVVPALGRYYFRLAAIRDPVDVTLKPSKSKSNDTAENATRQPTLSPTVQKAATTSTVTTLAPTAATRSRHTSAPTLRPSTSITPTEKTETDQKATTTPTTKTTDSPKGETTESPTLAPTIAAVSPDRVSLNDTSHVPSNSSNHTAPFQNTPTTLYRIPHYDSIQAANFTNHSCLLQNTDWFPVDKNDLWQLRAPYFTVIGARDSGESLIQSRLSQHSLVTTSQSTDFFSRPSFKKFLTREGQETVVWPARQALYARDFPTKRLKTDSSLISMDVSPNYLFKSPVLPQRILCVCPWIRLVVVLRDPAERVYASFRHAVASLGWRGTFAEYVEQDMTNMEHARLIGNHKIQQEEAWRQYLLLTADGPVGRSLYEVQLRQWFRALRDMGRNPLEAMHIVRYEQWKAQPDEEYQGLLHFLGLPPDDSSSSAATMSVSNSTSTISSPLVVDEQDEETMKKLRRFFRPYNKRLYKLLGQDWEGCWDDNNK